ELKTGVGWNPFPHLSIGNAGVDLFFVISGFVMVHASSDLFGRPELRREFMWRRIIRIVPLYWIVSGVLLVHALIRYSDLAAADLPPRVLIGSFFFIPTMRPSGDILPLLGVGWTLNYEMAFYLLLACSLALPKRVTVGATAAAIIAAVVIA